MASSISLYEVLIAFRKAIYTWTCIYICGERALIFPSALISRDQTLIMGLRFVPNNIQIDTGSTFSKCI